MYIRDLKNNEYFLEGVVSHDQELNGDERIDIDIHYTNNNSEFLTQHDDLKMWTIVFENKEYVIISSKMSGKGSKYMISVTGILYVLDWLNSNRVYQRIDASLTTTEAFDIVFENSPFTYILVDSATSEQFEGLGDGETKLEVFKTLIDRYGYEMNIVGNVVYLQSLVGNDTSFEYRYKVNASNITKETNAADLWTYVKGYADYDDNEEDVESKAKIKRDYVSPLESIIGSRRHAPPVKDGRVKYNSVLDKKMKEVVDNSVQISFSADINDMSQHGYDYQHAVVGDRVFLVDERIGLNTEIRVVQISRTINANNELRSMEITFGTQPLSESYSANFNNAVSSINDLLSGRKSLPFAALDIVSKSMVSKIQATTSEIVYDSNGQHFIDKRNNNNIMTMNSSGLLLSTDGGRTAKTAITAEGITADAITSGSITANYVRGGTFYGDNMTLENSLIISGVNNGIEGKFSYTDSADSYIPRRYVGEYRINNQALWFKGNIWRDTGQFLGYNTSFFAHDSVKFRRYENEDAYTNNDPSISTLDLTYQHLRLKRDGYPELKLENTGIATIPQIVGVYELINRERNIEVNVAHSNGGADLMVGVDQQGGFIKSNATYGRTTSGNANVYIGESGALYRSSSAMKYKTDIKREAPTNYKAILNLPSANWIDKEEKEYGIVKQRYFGHIAEDLIEVGLPQFVEYGKDQEVESIMYERLISPLLEVVKDHEQQIKELEEKVNGIK
ncbi:phage tail protein [Mammaliicoccus sciuri]|uniref:phage tail protein n=1 Tax=Mammaliicoccus sciuri TaxID=1296 RepID=UPI0007350513|nr:phage tail protein [Mammaliicoccus sciuri]